MLGMLSHTSQQIDNDLKQALGNKNPSEVWAQIVEKAQEFSLENPMSFEELAEQYNQDEPLLMLRLLEEASPVKALNLLHEISPDLDLQNLDKLSPGLLAKAALQIFSE
jgi:hypothetical protein